MTELLVSVRSLQEAKTALSGGAGIIDVKEPSRGSLGRALDSVITAVSEFVGDRRPVSAALGELLDETSSLVDQRLQYVKWGLAGCADEPTWRDRLHATGRRLRERMPSCHPVAVAYADAMIARAPSPADVCAFACEHQWGAFLLDTWHKNGLTLLDYLSVERIRQMTDMCRKRNVRVALAGSLSVNEIENLQHLTPDWFAVRRSVCVGGRRGVIDSDRVRELAKLLKESTPGS
jgi:uncharacterized protein (UPF0264 family)